MKTDRQGESGMWHPIRKLAIGTTAIAMTGLVLGAAAFAHDDAHKKHAAPGEPAGKAESGRSADARIVLHDHVLVDHTGRKLRFKSDVIGERIVVMDFVYTTCTTICPISTALLARAQAALAGSVGKAVRFVSVSVDPVTDTPRRLRAYAEKHGVGGDWRFLTGDKTSVDEVLTGLGAYTTLFKDHPAMVIVGDGRTGEWKRFFGTPDPGRIEATVKALLAARTPGNPVESAQSRH